MEKLVSDLVCLCQISPGLLVFGQCGDWPFLDSRVSLVPGLLILWVVKDKGNTSKCLQNKDQFSFIVFLEKILSNL